MKVYKHVGECPCCHQNSLIRHWDTDEIGFSDRCEGCDFEGLNITEYAEESLFDEPLNDILDIDTWMQF